MPPRSQTPSMPIADGTMPATRIGTKKMPVPMTFETTIAAASSGPRRRSSVGGVRLLESDRARSRAGSPASSMRQDHAVDFELAEAVELAAALAEELDGDVA